MAQILIQGRMWEVSSTRQVGGAWDMSSTSGNNPVTGLIAVVVIAVIAVIAHSEAAIILLLARNTLCEYSVSLFYQHDVVLYCASSFILLPIYR